MAVPNWKNRWCQESLKTEEELGLKTEEQVRHTPHTLTQPAPLGPIQKQRDQKEPIGLGQHVWRQQPSEEEKISF